ncbi:M23 family metallopeptidase [Calidifontibacter terrae]
MTSFLVLLWTATLVGVGAPATTVPQTGYDWPLSPPPPIARPFEPPPAPWAAGHRGVDLVGAEGAAVRSAGPGVVSWSGMLAGRGVVSVTHPNGWRTTYEPVEGRVPVGSRVMTGSLLGTLAVGGHCVPRVCLHWGLVIGDRNYRDPLRLLSTPPVVLLPVE